MHVYTHDIHISVFFHLTHQYCLSPSLYHSCLSPSLYHSTSVLSPNPVFLLLFPSPSLSPCRFISLPGYGAVELELDPICSCNCSTEKVLHFTCSATLVPLTCTHTCRNTHRGIYTCTCMCVLFNYAPQQAAEGAIYTECLG